MITNTASIAYTGLIEPKNPLIPVEVFDNIVCAPFPAAELYV